MTPLLYSTLIAALIIAQSFLTIATPLNITAPPWTWARDPAQCKTSVCISDCQTASFDLCNAADLTQSQNVTVGECTAFYWYDEGNAVPKPGQCIESFYHITGLPKSPGAPDDCPGYVGGVLGYYTSGIRTNDPLYIVYPSNGNGNCLKAPGDTSPVLAIDELPNGKTLQSCPAASPKRRARAADAELVVRDEDANWNDSKCNGEALGVGVGFSGTCVVSVTAAAWEFGPFVAAGWVACAGVGMASAVKLWKTCQQDYWDSQHQHGGRGLLEKDKKSGRRATPSKNEICAAIPQWSLPCPEWEQHILDVHQC